MGRVLRIPKTLAVQTAVFLIFLEVAGRLFDPLGISYYPETARFYDQIVLDPHLGYRLRPGLHETYYGHEVSINSIGMRDREVPIPKPTGEVRVLVMGDSVPFGIGVDVEDNIPRQIERFLSAVHGPSLTFRALNMGVPSYNTVQESLQLNRVGIGLDPDLVVLIVVPNDVEDKMWAYNRRRSPLANIAQRSYAICLLFKAGRLINERWSVVASDGLPAVNDGHRWHDFRTALSDIHGTLAARSIPLLVVINGEPTAEHAKHVQAVADKDGFYARHVRLEDSKLWQGPGVPYVNSVTDGHCNPYGCAMFAERVVALITELELLRKH